MDYCRYSLTFNQLVIRCVITSMYIFPFHPRGSGFTYGSGHDNSMYSQTSNMASYMEGSHGVQHNHLYQGYSNQQNHPGSMSVGVSAQAIGVAHQAQYLQPGQSANQRVPISHTTRASPMTVSTLRKLILYFHFS